MSTVTVFCADDDAGFRDVVRGLIENTPGFMLVGEASSGEEAVAAVPRLHPDLVLMDVRMSGMGGIEAARKLLRGDPEMIVVLMSAQELPPPCDDIRSAPVAMFVHKEHLCRRMLLELWRDRQRSGPNWVLVRLGGRVG